MNHSRTGLLNSATRLTPGEAQTQMVAGRQVGTGDYGLPVGLTFAIREAAGKAGQGIAGLQMHHRQGQAAAVGT